MTSTSELELNKINSGSFSINDINVGLNDLLFKKSILSLSLVIWTNSSVKNTLGNALLNSNTYAVTYLPENNKIEEGNKVYTSGKEGIFNPGIPIGEVEYDENQINVSLFSDLNQITFVNINLEHLEGK